MSNREAAGVEAALRDLIKEATFILRNAPLPNGSFSRLQRAIERARAAERDSKEDAHAGE